MTDSYDELTNDAKYLLLQMYKQYLEKRKKGFDKFPVRSLGDSTKIRNGFMSEWTLNDVTDTISELSRLAFVNARYASDTAISVELTTKGIAQMEGRFQDKANSILDEIAKIKALIPFI